MNMYLNITNVNLRISILLFVFGISLNLSAVEKSKSKATDAYLFVYFTGNNIEQEAIRIALSENGFSYNALNNNEAIIKSDQISATGGVRDPHILRTNNKKSFYMVATDMVSANGWNSNRGFVMLKSNDLIKWKSFKVNIPTAFPDKFGDVIRVWAPQTIYDPTVDKYMLYFSMLKKGAHEYDKIYYSYANKDFSALETEPKQLYFCPENKACIDGDIVHSEGKYHLFYKTEGHGNGLKKATANHLTGEWTPGNKYLQQTNKPVEGSCVFKLNNSANWILMYDMYTTGKYQFTISSDLENFKVIEDEIVMDFHPRHGTVISITDKEARRLKKYWSKK